MTTSHKPPSDEQPSRKGRPGNNALAIKLLEHWLETDESSDDISDWEELKKLLDQDRISGRKLFSNE